MLYSLSSPSKSGAAGVLSKSELAGGILLNGKGTKCGTKLWGRGGRKSFGKSFGDYLEEVPEDVDVRENGKWDDNETIILYTPPDM